jgi:RNA polymerase sigma-70 factor, ECF subfamily
MAQRRFGALGRGDRLLAAEAMSDPATTAPSATPPANERELLKAAGNGDQDAFAALVEPYRRELQVHCYRMLGSYADAEDAMQETLLRAWRGLARFEGRSSLRSWLYRIATNTSLRALERRPKRVLPIDYQPAGDPHDGLDDPVNEPIWLEPYPDSELGLEGPAGPEARYEQREAVELAFIAAIQNLPARQRAVLILRDVLGFSARESAAVLETTPVSIDSALQRAHKAVDDRLPSQSQQQTLRLLGDDQLSDLVERWVAAWERNDVDALVSMLAEDARIVMPPHPSWYSGRDQVALFLRTYPLRTDLRWKLVPTSANGQVAVGSYMWDEQAGGFTPARHQRAYRARQPNRGDHGLPRSRTAQALRAPGPGLTIRECGAARASSADGFRRLLGSQLMEPARGGHERGQNT